MEQILEIGQGWEFDLRDCVNLAPLTELQVEQPKGKSAIHIWLLVLVLAVAGILAYLYWKKEKEATIIRYETELT
jgi:hypothetical protein